MKTLSQYLLISLCAFILIACGGGGGSTADSTAGSSGGGSSDGSSGGGSANQVVTLKGQVNSFSDSTAGSQVVHRAIPTPVMQYKRAAAFRARLREATTSDELTADDMVATPAIVSVYELTDTEHADPIATVKTDADGSYDITTADMKEWLVDNGKVSASASDTAIADAVKALGNLEVRALVVSGSGEDESAIALSTIADPAAVGDDGKPKVVTVDPIVNQVITTALAQIRNSLQSLSAFGLSQQIINTIADQVVAQSSSTITTLLAAAKNETISIPEGDTAAAAVARYRTDAQVALTSTQRAALKNTIASSTAINKTTTGTLIAAAMDVTDVNARSTSVSAATTGVLANLNTTAGDKLNTLVNTNNLTGTAATKFQENKKDSLQRFFMDMGFAVVLDSNTDGTAAVVGISLPTPPQIRNEDLPGGNYIARQYRIFTVGSGALSSSGKFTTDKTKATSSVYYAPTLAAIKTQLLGTDTAEAFQEKVNAALSCINNPQQHNCNFALRDKVEFFHRFSQHVQENSGTLISQPLLNKILETTDTVKISDLADVIASNFQWYKEDVTLTEGGFPIYSQPLPLSGLSSTVNAGDILSNLTISLAANPNDAANALVNKASFYNTFASDAVQSSIQNARFQQSNSFDPQTALLAIYPTSEAGYRDLILGNAALGIPSTQSYIAARDDLSRGLAASIPPSLYGQTLTASTGLNVRSTLFLVKYLMENKYLIDAKGGFYKKATLSNKELALPNYNNVKFLQPNSDLTLGSFMRSVLNISDLADGDAFNTAVEGMSAGVADLPELPQFTQQGPVNPEDLGLTKNDTVTLTCTVKRYDGKDPNTSDAPLSLSLVGSEFNQQTHSIVEGDAVNATITSTASGTDPVLRTYTIANVPSGHQYQVKFSVEGYTSSLPSAFADVQGFSARQDVCPQEGFMIGPDGGNNLVIPGMGLQSDQARIVSGVSKKEGIDLSNFSVPGAPTILTADEETNNQGKVDFSLASTTTSGLFRLTGGIGVGFAPIYITTSGFAPTLTETDKPAHGLPSLLGSDLVSLITASKTAGVTSTNLDLNLSHFNPQTCADTCDFGRLYLFRDRDSNYWVLEIRSINGSGAQAHIDFGFVKINSAGQIDVPTLAANSGFKATGNGQQGNRHYQVAYGDWLMLERPDNYNGPEVLAPQVLSFGGEADYTALAEATNDAGVVLTGVVLRYAGEDFDSRITAREDFKTNFGNEPNADYSSIPTRLEAVSKDISLVKISFDKTTKTYSMSSDPDAAVAYVTNLKSGDIVVALQKNGNESKPVYLARVVGSSSNREIGLDVIPFNKDSQKQDDHVICFTGNETCDSTLPSVTVVDATTALGAVYDHDSDGVPAVFDPNDRDPNIGSMPNNAGGNNSTAGPNNGPANNNVVTINLLAEKDSNGATQRSFKLVVPGFPGEIKEVSLASQDISLAKQGVFGCSASEGTFTCTKKTVTGFTVAEDSVSSQQAAYLLSADNATTTLLAARTNVTFSYSVTFNPGKDPSGNNVTRAPISGNVVVGLPSTLAPPSDLKFAVGSNNADSINNIGSIDVSSPLTITASPVADAQSYQLLLTCAGVAGQPDQRIDRFMSAGQGSRPSFTLNNFDIAPLGGRSCRVEITAQLKNNVITRVVANSVSFQNANVGGNTGGNASSAASNELKFAATDVACFDGTAVTNDKSCSPANTLFTLSTSSNSVIATMSNAVNTAHTESGRNQLGGNKPFVAGSSLCVDSVSSAAQPKKGIWITAGSSCPTGLSALLVSRNNQLELASGLTGLGLFKDGHSTSSIAITTPGGYSIQAVGLGGGDWVQVGVEVFSVNNVTSAFLYVNSAGVNVDLRDVQSRQLTLVNPGSLSLEVTKSGKAQPLRFDVRQLDASKGAKLAWFKLPAITLVAAGDYDLGDTTAVDLRVSAISGGWSFAFQNTVTGVTKQEGQPTSVAAVSGISTATLLQSGADFVGFDFTLGGKRYHLDVKGLKGNNASFQVTQAAGGPPNGGQQ